MISFTTPVFVSILAYFLLGEKLGITPIAIALVTLIGIGVIARPPFLSGAQGFDPENLVRTSITFIAIGQLGTIKASNIIMEKLKTQTTIKLAENGLYLL